MVQRPSRWRWSNLEWDTRVASVTTVILDSMLICPVRGCHLPLMRQERRLLCERGHSFDVARSGYINLLQP
jgi:23S rRNA (guanine(745)-N(1))-methyltransferase RlmA-like protein